jgi:ribosomal protein L9
MKVNVAAFRQAYDHLWRVTNADYHACRGAGELTSWEQIAQGVLENVRSLECARANDYDLDQQKKAIEATTKRLEQCREAVATLKAQEAQKQQASQPQTPTDYAANLALFLQEKTGSVFGNWCGRMTANEQRELFGRFIGKGRIIIDGLNETICNRVKVCFGLDYDDRNLAHWRDLK